MRRFAAFATIVLSVALVAPSSLTSLAVLAQTSPQPAPEFRTGTAVVLLDVIARDKKGRPVRDLRAEELQVFENDQRCDIRSFRLVESEGTIEPGAAGAVSAPLTPVEPAAAGGAPAEGKRAPFNLVTLVFDRMTSPLVRSDPGLLVKRDPWDGSGFGGSVGDGGVQPPTAASLLGDAVRNACGRPS